MTALTYEHKRTLGETRHMLDEYSFFDNIVPPEVTEVIQAFASELSALPPMHVPLLEDAKAVYGWPLDGINEKIRTDGGSVRFGWRLREWPAVLLTAEPHAIWVDPDGTFIDITPDIAAGDRSLFVPAANDSDPFDFDQIPPTRYHTLRAASDRSAEVAERIARMKSGQRAYEARRAQKAGKTLEEWTFDKYYYDPLPSQIAAFIAACEAFDAKLPTLPDLIGVDPDSEQPELLYHESSVPHAAEVTPEFAGAMAGDAACGADEENASAEPLPAPGTPLAVTAADDLDANPAPDDDEDTFDETWMAVDSLERWSQGRNTARRAIIRTLMGE